jgi:hypothetical protein
MNMITQPWAKYTSDQLNSATENTYGKGINPEAVGEMLVAANDLLRFESALRVMEDMLATPEPFFKILATLKAAIDKATIK